MMEFLSGMIRLPMSAMTTGMDMFTEAARGVSRLAGEGLNYVGVSQDDPASKKPGPTPSRRAAGGLEAGGVKLVEYVLVDLDRGREQIVDRGYRVISRPTTEHRFAAETIDAFNARAAGPASTTLEAYVQVLERWER